MKTNFKELDMKLDCEVCDNYNILLLINDLFILLIKLPITIVGSYLIMLIWTLYKITLNIFSKIGRK